MAVASVVIPAHNESASIARTLAALATGVEPGDLEVVVVANGCSDRTAQIARSANPPVRVRKIGQPSKSEAVRVGNATASVFPRVHLDADIELTGADVLRLVQPLIAGEVLATAPRREVPREGCSWPVRWFYDVWERLPQVESGLFGRGVVVVGEEGQRRLDALPRMLGDDLAMSDAFGETERRVVAEAVAVVHPPRTLRDLLRRRIRIVTGNHQADAADVRRASSRTSPRVLLALVAEQPRLAGPVAVFVAVHLTARIAARRAIRAGDFTTWQRDESSRVKTLRGVASGARS